MNTTLLLGSEDVSRAGHNMQSAANDMLRAADSIADSARRLELLFGSGYGTNIDRLIEALEKRGEPKKPACVCGFCDGSDCNY